MLFAKIKIVSCKGRRQTLCRKTIPRLCMYINTPANESKLKFLSKLVISLSFMTVNFYLLFH